MTTLFDSDPGKLPTPFWSIIFCALLQEPFRYSGRPESRNCPIFLAHVLSPKEELSLVASVVDPGDVIVDDVHTEFTLGSTTFRFNPLGTCFQIGWHIFPFEYFFVFTGKRRNRCVTLA